ncbi:MAG: hypothetical protein PW735_11745 [Acidobacteriaceae bacterium]|nr:hypothetical protein [Acidobacteriaceae bacterium]
MSRNSLLWATLACWSCLGVRGAFAACHFRNAASDNAVTYRFALDETPSGRRFLITMTFRVKANTPTTIEIPSELISDLHVTSPGAKLKNTSDGDMVVSASKSGLVTVSYTLRNGLSGPLVHPREFQPVILDQYAEITGDKALIWRKDDDQAQVTANFDWQALPPEWAVATSFGVAYPATTDDSKQISSSSRDRCQTYRGPWSGVNQALFAAGDFRLHRFPIGSQSGVLAVRGTWTFSDEEAANEIGRTVQLVRDFWHDDAFPFFLVTLQPFDQDHGSSDGTAYTDAFWMYVSRKDNINRLLGQLAHESFHAWNPLKMGYLSTTEYAKTKWFKEGFTEYYAQKLTLAGGERSTEQVVSSINRDLLAFPASTNEYVRGRIIALWLDAAIRERSNGQHSLDDVMLQLVRDRQEALTEERIYATIQPFLSTEQLGALKKAADSGGDLPAPDKIPGLSACYRARHGEFPTFDLGFDFTSSRAAKTVSGVDPSGPAYKAGLRDGQQIVGWDVDRGNTERQAAVTVRIEGQEQRISFRPLGEPKAAWQYQPETDACAAKPTSTTAY